MFSHINVLGGAVYSQSCTRSAIKRLFEFSACYVSGTMQIQLNNLLILISKSAFATELHPIPPRVLFPLQADIKPLCPS